MGTSGNPAKKAAAKKTAAKKTTTKKASSPRSVKQNSQAQQPTQASSPAEIKARAAGKLLQMPSGLIFRCRRVDLQAFLSSGEVVNPLMAAVLDTLEKGQEFDVKEALGVEDGQVDVDRVNDMFETVQRVVMNSVAEPKIHPLPEEGEDRDDDLVYIDEVDEEDMMFIMQWALGGTDDLATFREEAASSLAAVAQG